MMVPLLNALAPVLKENKRLKQVRRLVTATIATKDNNKETFIISELLKHIDLTDDDGILRMSADRVEELSELYYSLPLILTIVDFSEELKERSRWQAG